MHYCLKKIQCKNGTNLWQFDRVTYSPNSEISNIKIRHSPCILQIYVYTVSFTVLYNVSIDEEPVLATEIDG